MIIRLIFLSFCFDNLYSARAFDDEANIIGGSDTSIYEFPYQASIRAFGEHACGGAIISVRHILTAAHCVIDLAVPPFQYLKIVTGTSSPDTGGQLHNVRKIHIYPEYSKDSSLKNDIAIVTLFKSMVFSSIQQAIEISKSEIHDFSNGVITGWGMTNFPSNILPTTLQKLDVVVISNEECQESFDEYIYPINLCGYSGYEYGICLGDSGSPLVVNGKVAAIASWTTPCATGKPDIYTRVFDYINYIEAILSP